MRKTYCQGDIMYLSHNTTTRVEKEDNIRFTNIPIAI
jgi:hypothetical protein